MTKLQQWLAVGIVYLAVWLSLTLRYIPLSDAWHQVACLSPLFFLMSFACYSLAVIGYRVATFNDCTEAAEQLKKQIAEAKADLRSKGMNIP